jgi:hypothetical protein
MGVLMMVSGTSLAGPATAATQKPGSVVFIYDNIGMGNKDQSEMHQNHWDWFTCNIPAITCYHQVQVAFEGSEDNKPETVDHDLTIGPVQHLQVLDTYTLNGGVRGRGATRTSLTSSTFQCPPAIRNCLFRCPISTSFNLGIFISF